MRFSIVIPTYNRLERLKNLLGSFDNLDYPEDQFEIIIASDGSTDGTKEYVESIANNRIKILQLKNRGPAIARNKGAEIANGEILVFIDDDCSVDNDWLKKIDSYYQTGNYSALGGINKNMKTELLPAVVYEEMNNFFLKKKNMDSSRAKYLMSNNFSCKRDVFEKYGGFDERFTIGAEDRELVLRLTAGGEKTGFFEELSVNHFHPFSVKSFLFQHFRFGRGSYLLYNVVNNKNLRKEKTKFSEIFELLKELRKESSFFKWIKKSILVLFAQLFIALGYFSAKLEGVTDLSKEDSHSSKTFTSGNKGTAGGFYTFLSGNILSSFFGFLTFLIISKSLTLEKFGVFTVAFSLFSIVTKISNFGLNTGIIRYGAEFNKNNDKDKVASILKSGLVLQIIILAAVLTALYFSVDVINALFLSKHIPRKLLIGTLVGISGAVALNYFLVIYSIKLEFIRLTVINNIVSLSRFVLIIAIYFFYDYNTGIYFWFFILPFWIGVFLVAPKFMKFISGRGKVSAEESKKIIIYGGWQTLTGITRQTLRHIGPLILAVFVGKTEAGLFGLGMSLSFIFGVLLNNIRSYFLPIGSKMIHDDEIIPFFKRSLRLTFPVAVLGALVILFAYPFILLYYGEAKVAAFPVFLFLSLPSVMKLLFSAVVVLLHYFFKPQYIAYEVLIRLALFLAFSVFFIRFGALGVSFEVFIVSVIGLFILFGFVKKEFSERGIEFNFRMLFSRNKD